MILQLTMKAGKWALALALSFLLFVSISMLHSLVGFGRLDAPKVAGQKRIIAELVRPAKTEPPRTQSRIRQVQTSNTTMRAEAGRQLDFRIAPDLSIEGGGDNAVSLQAGQSMQAEIFEEGQVDDPPVPVSLPPIPFPDRARELGVQGTLVANIVINIDGKVSSVEVLKSPHPSLTAAARKTMSIWRFKPARNKGMPVRMRMRQEVDFAQE